MPTSCSRAAAKRPSPRLPWPVSPPPGLFPPEAEIRRRHLGRSMLAGMASSWGRVRGALSSRASSTLLARGARIYAELAGAGMSSDAFHMTLPDETGESQSRAMKAALAEAGIDPTDLDYVNAHGTATPAGDIAETRALKATLGDHAKRVAVSSNKSMIGHCLGASGAIEAVATVLTIVNGVVPPTMNLTHPDPECDLDYVPLRSREHTCRRGGQQQLRLRRPQRDACLPPLRRLAAR